MRVGTAGQEWALLPLVRAIWDGALLGPGACRGHRHRRVRGEIMGSQKCGIVGKSQPVLMMTNPMINPSISACVRPAWTQGHRVGMRGEIMRSPPRGIVGKSQPARVMINPGISTRTPTPRLFLASTAEALAVLEPGCGGPH
eukprot:COSAG01_NODE_5158_length_4445_cov_12.910953_3_plen_142_part_00